MNKRLPSLDGWRAIAITLVIFDHWMYTTNFPLKPNAAWSFTFDGNLGVRVFFIISGFLITYLLLQEAARFQSVSLKQFYIRRAFRILPIYFVYLFTLLIIQFFGAYHDSMSSWLGAFTFTRNYVGQGRSATVHFWTLAVEEQFYLLWPILLTCCSLWRRQRLAFVLLFCAIISSPLFRIIGYQEEPGGNFFHRLTGLRSILLYADSLAWGAFGAFVFIGESFLENWRRFLNAAWLLAALILIATPKVFEIVVRVGGAQAMLVNALCPSLQAAGILFLLLYSIHRHESWLYRVLNLRLVSHVGVLSYSLYVWHVMFLSHFMGKNYSAYQLYDWRFWILPAVAASILSFYCVERPMLALKERFNRPERRLSPPRIVHEATAQQPL